MTIAEEIHGVCAAARPCPCTWCGAHPGQPCDDPRGTHLRRIITGRLDGHVSEQAAALAFAYSGVCTESTIVRDEGAAA